MLWHVDTTNTINFTEAVALAKASDVVILALGLSSANMPTGSASGSDQVLQNPCCSIISSSKSLLLILQ